MRTMVFAPLSDEVTLKVTDFLKNLAAQPALIDINMTHRGDYGF